jgi:hypothetical protein
MISDLYGLHLVLFRILTGDILDRGRTFENDGSLFTIVEIFARKLHRILHER